MFSRDCFSRNLLDERVALLLQPYEPRIFVVRSRVRIVNAMRNPPRPERTVLIGSKWRGRDRICLLFLFDQNRRETNWEEI